jgi:hypothetical protein
MTDILVLSQLAAITWQLWGNAEWIGWESFGRALASKTKG